MNSAGKKKCLVLGGKGFVGSAVVREASRRGYEVLVVDKDEYAEAVGTSCDVLVNANGNSRKYLAAQDPSLEFDLSVRSVVKSLQDFKAGLYVHLSSIDVYPVVNDPAGNSETAEIECAKLSPYGFHKYMAEQLVQRYAANWLIVRMAGFVGEGLKKNSIFDLLNGQPLRVHPDSEYQYLNSRDMASVIFTLVEKGLSKEIFNVAGDGVIAIRDVAAMIPDCSPRLEQGLQRERYEVNLDKIKQHAAIPKTADTVKAFIREVLKDRKKNA